jgi:hypothetical protein
MVDQEQAQTARRCALHILSQQAIAKDELRRTEFTTASDWQGFLLA